MAVTFRVQGVSESPSRLRVRVRDFDVVVDEPPSLGGSDEGPNPVEYVLAALAGCLNVVGHMVAREMGITMRSLAFRLEGRLDPAGFAGKDESVRSGYQSIDVKVETDSDADEATLEAWLRTVEKRCPVSDNLARATPVHISRVSA